MPINFPTGFENLVVHDYTRYEPNFQQDIVSACLDGMYCIVGESAFDMIPYPDGKYYNGLRFWLVRRDGTRLTRLGHASYIPPAYKQDPNSPGYVELGFMERMDDTTALVGVTLGENSVYYFVVQRDGDNLNIGTPIKVADWYGFRADCIALTPTLAIGSSNGDARSAGDRYFLLHRSGLTLTKGAEVVTGGAQPFGGARISDTRAVVAWGTATETGGMYVGLLDASGGGLTLVHSLHTTIDVGGNPNGQNQPPQDSVTTSVDWCVLGNGAIAFTYRYVGPKHTFFLTGSTVEWTEYGSKAGTAVFTAVGDSIVKGGETLFGADLSAWTGGFVPLNARIGAVGPGRAVVSATMYVGEKNPTPEGTRYPREVQQWMWEVRLTGSTLQQVGPGVRVPLTVADARPEWPELDLFLGGGAVKYGVYAWNDWNGPEPTDPAILAWHGGGSPSNWFYAKVFTLGIPPLRQKQRDDDLLETGPRQGERRNRPRSFQRSVRQYPHGTYA